MVARGLFGLFILSALLSACGTLGSHDDIVGNNTGGVIPAARAQKENVFNLANAHCAKYGLPANITYNGVEAGGEVVFVCQAPGTQFPGTRPPTPAAGPQVIPAPPPPPTKSAAKQR